MKLSKQKIKEFVNVPENSRHETLREEDKDKYLFLLRPGTWTFEMVEQ
ncbi:MAG: hypothetical protein LBQ50_07880 [Planctomycetaceae bacterium]|nr:hypothetical protein [Planctomycetaceae bacterium]